MSFEEIETSQEQGAPIECFEFKFGPRAGDVYRYTTHTQEVVAGGRRYYPAPVRRDSIKTSGKLDKTNISVSLAKDVDLAALFLPYPPPYVVRLNIRAGHVGEQEFPLVWLGRVVSVSPIEENEVKLTCETTTIALKRPGLRRLYQHMCQFLLYGPDCKADQTRHMIETEVELKLDNGRIRLPDNWFGTEDPASFAGGMMTWDGPNGLEARTILRAANSTMALAGYLTGLETGTKLTLYVGCAHDTEDCEHLHDNILNFGGQPWIPFKNPVKSHPFW